MFDVASRKRRRFRRAFFLGILRVEIKLRPFWLRSPLLLEHHISGAITFFRLSTNSSHPKQRLDRRISVSAHRSTVLRGVCSYSNRISCDEVRILC